MDDAQRFEERFESAAPALWAWAVLRCQGPLGRGLEPDDLVQEVCIAALGAEARFDPDQGAWRAWLFGIAHRVSNDLLRRLARGARRLEGSGGGILEIPDAVTTVSRRVRRSEALAGFLERVGELDPDDRELLVHRGLEGLGHRDVAALMGWTPEAAAKRWQRLRDRLQSWPSVRSLIDDV